MITDERLEEIRILCSLAYKHSFAGTEGNELLAEIDRLRLEARCPKPEAAKFTKDVMLNSEAPDAPNPGLPEPAKGHPSQWTASVEGRLQALEAHRDVSNLGSHMLNERMRELALNLKQHESGVDDAGNPVPDSLADRLRHVERQIFQLQSERPAVQELREHIQKAGTTPSGVVEAGGKLVVTTELPARIDGLAKMRDTIEALKKLRKTIRVTGSTPDGRVQWTVDHNAGMELWRALDALESKRKVPPDGQAAQA